MIEEFDFLLGFLPEVAIKPGVACLCGLLLGMEREWRGKPAGLRTITLMTVGATLFMIVSDLVALTIDGPEAITRVDPSRIASQVVSGIGFLGAGAIIQSRGSIHGLTTAATVWVAASIGLCVGVRKGRAVSVYWRSLRRWRGSGGRPSTSTRNRGTRPRGIETEGGAGVEPSGR